MKTYSETIHPYNCTTIDCRIMVYDNDNETHDLIRTIAPKGNLITPKREVVDILSLLGNTDLQETDICAIFLTEVEDSDGLTGFDIAKLIQKSRDNIPIFMRLRDGRSITDLNNEQRSLVTGCYTNSDPEMLKKKANTFVCGFYFPNALVNIFSDTGLEILESVFKGCEVTGSQPFMLFDHSITKSLTSLLPIQFSFGNGILAVLTKESDILSLIENKHTSLYENQTGNTHINQVVSELTNLYWGKVRQICDQIFKSSGDRSTVNIPMVINHNQKYINFGNHTPELCFRYMIIPDTAIPDPIIIEFKLIFNSLIQLNDFSYHTPSESGFDEEGFFESF